MRRSLTSTLGNSRSGGDIRGEVFRRRLSQGEGGSRDQEGRYEPGYKKTPLCLKLGQNGVG